MRISALDKKSPLIFKNEKISPLISKPIFSVPPYFKGGIPCFAHESSNIFHYRKSQGRRHVFESGGAKWFPKFLQVLLAHACPYNFASCRFIYNHCKYLSFCRKYITTCLVSNFNVFFWWHMTYIGSLSSCFSQLRSGLNLFLFHHGWRKF